MQGLPIYQSEIISFALEKHFVDFYLIYWTSVYAVNTFLKVLLGKMWKNMKKSAVFPGGYGRIGEILHGRIWPDWGLYLTGDIELIDMRQGFKNIMTCSRANS